MPSANPETIEEIEEFLIGNDPLDVQATRYLEEQGYILTPEWEWHKPGVTDLEQMTRREFACLLYMCHEWDYGGLA